jgi:archaemetzincin
MLFSKLPIKGIVMNIFILVFVTIISTGFNSGSVKQIAKSSLKRVDTIYVLNLGYFEKELDKHVVKELKQFYNLPVKRLPNMPVNESARNPAGKYTATIILDDLKKQNTQLSGVILALTKVDVSFNNKPRNAPYWGVFGLAYLGNYETKLNPCIISTKRMTTNLYERLAKVTLHEVGHAFGLPHCKVDATCLMSDAKGLGKTVDLVKKQFCSSCEIKYQNRNKKKILV